MQFSIKIADCILRIKSVYDEIYCMCSDYIVKSDSGPLITITQSDIELERSRSAQNDAFEGKAARSYSDSYLETLAVYRKICDYLTEKDILLFHSSAVNVDGYAYLFAAPSGTGKSTHAKLWKEYLGDSFSYINDDKPLLKIFGDKIYVYGTPWDGKHRLSNNTRAELKAICLLERDDSNSIVKIDACKSFAELLSQTYRPGEPELYVKTISLLNKIMKAVTVYSMRCNMNIEAAQLAYKTMSKGE